MDSLATDAMEEVIGPPVSIACIGVGSLVWRRGTSSLTPLHPYGEIFTQVPVFK